MKKLFSILIVVLIVGGFAGTVLVLGFDAFGWRQTLVVAGAILTLAIVAASRIIGRNRNETGEPVEDLLT